MKLHFEEKLPHQLAAIEAVCDLFRGQEICRTEFTVTRRSLSPQMGLALEPGVEEYALGIGNRLVTGRRAAWERWYGPVAAARWGSAAWHTVAWAVFGSAYVGAVVFVSTRLGSPPGDVLLVLAAGSRLNVGPYRRGSGRALISTASAASSPWT